MFYMTDRFIVFFKISYRNQSRFPNFSEDDFAQSCFNNKAVSHVTDRTCVLMCGQCQKGQRNMQ